MGTTGAPAAGYDHRQQVPKRPENRVKIEGMIDFVAIPAGWFLMGSDEGQADEGPTHRVWVDAFEMAVYPVTRREYADFKDATSRAAPREWDNPGLR